MVTAIQLFALISSFPHLYYAKYGRKSETNSKLQLQLWQCIPSLSSKSMLALEVKNLLLINLIPMTITSIFQILTQAVLKVSSDRLLHNELNSSASHFNYLVSRVQVMKKITKIFGAVILFFFISTIPPALYFLSMNYIKIFHPEILTPYGAVGQYLSHFFNLLATLHSCIIPLIYAVGRAYYKKAQNNGKREDVNQQGFEVATTF